MSDLNGTSGGARLRPALITGGAGFVGTNLADRLLRGGRRVRVLDDLSRPGVERNLAWLEREHGGLLEAEIADVRDRGALRRSLRGVRDVFHFAAQVAVTSSMDDPLDDAGVNLQGTLNLLEEARALPRPPTIVFTSTNKVYGGLDDVELIAADDRYEPADERLRAGIGEDRPLRFCTPYGCSKGAADQYVLDYGSTYRVPTVVLRMSCVYGPHQHGNEDQGWVAHFLRAAMEEVPLTIYGDGRQVRDVLFVEDLVSAMLLACRNLDRVAGRAFNVGGGTANAVSLLEVVALIEEILGVAPQVTFGPWRQSDQRWYVSDTSRLRAAIGWAPVTAPAAGLRLLRDWLRQGPEGGSPLDGDGVASALHGHPA